MAGKHVETSHFKYYNLITESDSLIDSNQTSIIHWILPDETHRVNLILKKYKYVQNRDASEESWSGAPYISPAYSCL